MKAVFTTGNTMRHVAVMTSTSAVGLVSLFLVDAANLFYISLLGQLELAAAIGFAGTVQFFMISISIGLAISATAVVSRAIGAGDRERARRLATSALAVLVTVLSLAAFGMWLARDWALGLLGAEGETLGVASRFLSFVLPSLPLLGVGMVTGGLLRAAGDGRRAMWVTLTGGLVAAALDPVLIFAMGLGIDGAAIASGLSRLVLAVVGMRYVVGVHNLLGRCGAGTILADARSLASIAGPAVATQLSTPFGMAFLTSTVAAHGDDAVAGWAVVGRLSALAFGTIFSLSGAVGPIIGQNYGAGLPERIRSAYRDALLFAWGYVLFAWAVLYLATDAIIAGFSLTGRGAEVFAAFTQYGAGAYLFTSALFVSNAAFNNLGRPMWSTLCNWSRDGLAIPALAFLIGAQAGATGAVTIQALAGFLVGLGAAIFAYRYIRRMARDARHGEEKPLAGMPVQPAFASGRAVLAQIGGDPETKPLAETEKNR